MPNNNNEKGNDKELVDSIAPTEKLPSMERQIDSFPVKVPSGAKTPEGKDKGYGFVHIPSNVLKAHPVWFEDHTPTSAQLRELEKGLFVHAKSVSGLPKGAPLEGVEIVPLLIKFDQGKGKYKIDEARTLEKHLENLEIQQIHEERERKEEEARQQEQKIINEEIDRFFKYLKDKSYSLTDKELGEIANKAVTWDRKITLEERIQSAENAVADKIKLNEFTANLPEYRKKAQEVADQCGGVVIETQFSIFVRIEVPEHERDVWKGAYETAEAVDFWLAERRGGLPREEKVTILNPGERSQESQHLKVGLYSGVRISTTYWEDDGDMYHQGGGHSGVWYTAEERPNEPDFFSKAVVWGIHYKEGPLTEKTANADQIREDLFSQKKWIEIAEKAKQYKEEKIRADERVQEEMKEAVDYIKWLKLKVGTYSATPGETVERDWIGLKAISTARHAHSGFVKGAYVEHSCVVEIPGFGGLDLEKPNEWEGDLREAAKLLREYWKKSQPKGAVIPDETVAEAGWRLEKYAYSPDNLPTIEGMTWKGGRSDRAYAYEDPDLESLTKDMPNVLGEWDSEHREYYTHELVLTGKGVKEQVVGYVIIRPGRRDPGYIGEVVGFPHYTVGNILRDNPNLDPRLLNLQWRPKVPTTME